MDSVIIKFAIDFFPGFVPLLAFFLYFKSYRDFNEKIIDAKITIKEADKLFENLSGNKSEVLSNYFIEDIEMENYLKRKGDIINDIDFLSGESYLLLVASVISLFFSFIMLYILVPSVTADSAHTDHQKSITIFIGVISFSMYTFAYFTTNKKLIEVKRFFMLARLPK